MFYNMGGTRDSLNLLDTLVGVSMLLVFEVWVEYLCGFSTLDTFLVKGLDHCLKT